MTEKTKEVRIEKIPISRMVPFKDHPFKVQEGEELDRLMESIEKSGVLVPVLVRPAADGNYEMISGHRRMAACKALGITELPAVVRNLSDEEWKRAAWAASAIAGTNIYLNDNPTLTVAEMNAQCRRLRNLGMVMIDYLQLMQGSGSSNNYAGETRTQVVSDISRMMKIMAKELNVPVLCLSQLSRANEQRQDKRPML